MLIDIYVHGSHRMFPNTNHAVRQYPYYRPQGNVMLSEASVSHSVHRGEGGEGEVLPLRGGGGGFAFGWGGLPNSPGSDI